jgi:hypothetical protein
MTGDDEMALAASRAVIDVAKDWIKVYQRGGEPVLGLHHGGTVGSQQPLCGDQGQS